MTGAFHPRKGLLALTLGAVVLIVSACSSAAPAPTAAPAAPTKAAAPAATQAPAAQAAATQAPAAQAPATPAAAAKPAAGSLPAQSGIGAPALQALGVQAKKPYTIGLSFQQLTDPFFIAISYGAEQEAKKDGVNLIIHEAGGYQYADKQIAQIEDFIQRKVDAMIIMPTNANAVKPVVEKAAADGIKVMTQGSTIPTDKLFTFVRADDTELGSLQADYMGKALAGKGNVVMLAGPAGVTWTVERSAGFENELKAKYPDMKVLGKYWIDSARVAGMKQTQDSLQAFPDLNGIYSSADIMGQGAADAVKAAGKSGKIVITAASMSKDYGDMITQGLADFTAAQQPVLMAATSIDAAVRYLNGEDVPKQVFIKALPISKDNIKSVDLTTIYPPDGYKPSLVQ